MPFPLAHPAAVLPFKRYCPKYLSFPALVAGSLGPDISYAFGESGMSDIAHSFLGGIAFGCIVGWLMLACYDAFAPLVLVRCPERLRRALLPLCQPSKNGPAIVLLSLCIGTCTHLLLDSSSHTHGWIVGHLAILQTPLFSIAGRKAEVCTVLWYGCSYLGVAVLVLALRESQEPANASGNEHARKSHIIEAFLVATLVLPIELLHHLMRSRLGFALVAASSLALLVLVLARPAIRSRS